MRIVTLSALSVLLACSITTAGAQTEQKTTHEKVRTLTGCLEKSGEANEYNGKTNEYKLTTESGATWEVKSDAVNLAKHVGHTVTVTGTVSNAAAHGMKEDAKQEAQEHGMAKGAERGHLTATELKMVSETCKK